MEGKWHVRGALARGLRRVVKLVWQQQAADAAPVVGLPSDALDPCHAATLPR